MVEIGTKTSAVHVGNPAAPLVEEEKVLAHFLAALQALFELFLAKKWPR